MKTIICMVFLATAASAGGPDDDNVRKLTKACNTFAHRLFKKIAVPELNSVYSPVSVHQALAMTLLGAAGETATEMSNALGLNVLTGGSSQAHVAYKNVSEQLNSAADVQLLSANAIFLNPKMEIDTKFVLSAQDYYQAEVSHFDLLSPGGPHKKVNEYISNKTNGMINDLLQPGSIDASTVMALINTLFFNGTWQKQFSKSRTRESDFHTPNGIVKIDTMFDDRRINLKRNFYGADVGEIPFQGGRFSLVILLTHSADGLPAQEESLSIPGRIDSLFRGLTPVRVRLSLPKIKVESTYELNTPLKALGIIKAFNPGEADFTGMCSAGDIYLSKVVTKTVIEIIETGTVAAAAAAVILGRASLHNPPEETFYVKYPFMYFIYDRQLDLILFMGRYSHHH